MSGDARTEWTHEIPKRKTYTVDGKSIKKDDDYRRISMTYRTIA
jgi:alkylated DNA repair dioxygenase AlkB